jgi:hypothetical protein
MDNEIEIEVRFISISNSFQASIVGDRRNTAQEGNTEAEAIGKLVINYLCVFGVTIVKK